MTSHFCISFQTRWLCPLEMVDILNNNSKCLTTIFALNAAVDSIVKRKIFFNVCPKSEGHECQYGKVHEEDMKN